MARDWEDVIAIVQGDGPHADLISFDAEQAPATAASTPAPEPVAAPAPEPVVEVLSTPVAEAPAPEVVPEEPKVTAAASAVGTDLPADPFA